MIQPQLGTSITGRDNIKAARTAHPGRELVKVDVVMGQADLWVAECVFSEARKAADDGKCARVLRGPRSPASANTLVRSTPRPRDIGPLIHVKALRRRPRYSVTIHHSRDRRHDLDCTVTAGRGRIDCRSVCLPAMRLISAWSRCLSPC